MDLLGELRTLIVRHASGAPRHRATILDGVTITCVTEPTPPAAVMSEPSLAVVGQGVKRTVLNGVPYDYRAGQYLVVSLDLPVIGQALEASPEEPFAVFTMRLKRRRSPHCCWKRPVPRSRRPLPASRSATRHRICSTRLSGCCACWIARMISASWRPAWSGRSSGVSLPVNRALSSGRSVSPTAT